MDLEAQSEKERSTPRSRGIYPINKNSLSLRLREPKRNNSSPAGCSNQEETEDVLPLLFFSKPTINSHLAGNREEICPLQLAFQGTEGRAPWMALAIPLDQADTAFVAATVQDGPTATNEGPQGGSLFDALTRSQYTVISWPEQSALDSLELRRSVALFIVAAGGSALMTLFIFTSPDPDVSMVDPPQHYYPLPFEQSGRRHSPAETAHVVVTLLLLAFGVLAVLSKATALLRIYMGCILVYFIAGVLTEPYFILATRHVADIFLFFLAKEIWKKLSVHWTNIGILQ